MKLFDDSIEQYNKHVQELKEEAREIIADILYRKLDSVKRIAIRKLPDYNPDWCIRDDYNFLMPDIERSVMQLASVIANELFAYSYKYSEYD